MKKHIYILTFITLIIDQFIKMIVVKNLSLGASISLIPGFFKIQYVENTGGAWGILGDSTWILILVSAGAIILLNKYLAKETDKGFSKFSILAYGLLMGGILGNLIDRLLHGAVIDYLSFMIFSYDFPVFNLADMAIIVGMVLLIIDLMRGEINERYNRKGRC
ncbi:MAG: signal peptidase II [Bacilli bacterium]